MITIRDKFEVNVYGPERVASLCSDKSTWNQCDTIERKLEKGTTTFAFVYKMGAIIAVDHSNKSSTFPPNVVELSSHMLATISGGYEFLLNNLQKKCQQHELKVGRRTKIAEALQWLRESVSSYGQEGLEIGMLVAVWDETERGLYRVNGKGEAFNELFLAATGSGSIFAKSTFTYVMQPYTQRMISITEAADLAKRSICTGASKAPESGDRVSVYHLGSTGCRELLDDDMVEWQSQNLPQEWELLDDDMVE